MRRGAAAKTPGMPFGARRAKIHLMAAKTAACSTQFINSSSISSLRERTK